MSGGGAERRPLSVTMIAFNEADRIGAALDAVRAIADDVLVVDSGSTDETVAVAEAHGARVLHRDWEGYGPQKRFAEAEARHDWILNLDADEVLTPELAAEIRHVLDAPEPAFRGYRINLLTVYPGDQRPRLWANGHNQIRLYDRRAMSFRTSLVHDTVDEAGQPVGQMRHPAYHFSFRSMAHLRAKQDSYTTLQAKELKKKTWVLLLRLPFEYPLMFLRYLLIRTHITGGFKGLEISHIAAKYRTLRLWKILKAKSASKQAEPSAGTVSGG
ncbi:MAG: glycosyltransferase family 2 protein [Asticcacaulis sp.]